MKQDKKIVQPDHTAVRVALWRAMHFQIDTPPHIFEDEIGFKLVAPGDDWRQRPDMNPDAFKRIRASIAARARFIEDMVAEQILQGVSQYVILGAGLDTFVQRKPEIASKLQVYEIDQPDTQVWKKQRLIELGYGIPEYLHFVSVDFEAGLSWWELLKKAGFNTGQPTVIACTGVSMYLTKDAILATLRQIAKLAPGSKLAMTFMLPLELIEAEDRSMQEMSEKGARASGTPFISFFSPEEMSTLAIEAGFKKVQSVLAKNLAERYFSGRSDNLCPASGEAFLIGTT
jgi:methyltransferase (TIGR00027 family)